MTARCMPSLLLFCVCRSVQDVNSSHLNLILATVKKSNVNCNWVKSLSSLRFTRHIHHRHCLGKNISPSVKDELIWKTSDKHLKIAAFIHSNLSKLFNFVIYSCFRGTFTNVYYTANVLQKKCILQMKTCTSNRHLVDENECKLFRY